MNNISKNYVNEEGKEETIVANSNDNYNVNLDGKYTIANREKNNEKVLVRRFKRSLFGSDIGIKSKGFSSVAVLAVVIALAVLVMLYFMWRF